MNMKARFIVLTVLAVGAFSATANAESYSPYDITYTTNVVDGAVQVEAHLLYDLERILDEYGVAQSTEFVDIKAEYVIEGAKVDAKARPLERDALFVSLGKAQINWSSKSTLVKGVVVLTLSANGVTKKLDTLPFWVEVRGKQAVLLSHRDYLKRMQSAHAKRPKPSADKMLLNLEPGDKPGKRFIRKQSKR